MIIKLNDSPVTEAKSAKELLQVLCDKLNGKIGVAKDFFFIRTIGHVIAFRPSANSEQHTRMCALLALWACLETQRSEGTYAILGDTYKSAGEIHFEDAESIERCIEFISSFRLEDVKLVK